MPGGGQRRRRRKARAAPPSPPIHSLSDDLVLEIFLRLPSLATLVRGACSCRAWRRAVASSPAFRRRFRALHPPPLLGIFFTVTESCAPSPFPAFVPVRPSDPVRGGDFFLTSLQDCPGSEAPLVIDECLGGYVLLSDAISSCYKRFAVLSPLSRQDKFERVLVSSPLASYVLCEFQFNHQHLVPRLLCSDDDPGSFRLLDLAVGDTRVCAAVFSSDTGEWSLLPSMEVNLPLIDDEGMSNMQANGILYWVSEDPRQLVSLDVATMEFTIAELPQCLRYSSFHMGENKDGTTCIVYADGSDVGVLLSTRDDDGVERWILDRVVSMDMELARIGLDPDDDAWDPQVIAVWEGHAYLATSMMFHDPRTPCWFLSLCLETMKLEKLFQRTYDRTGHLYIMPWPSCLTGNHGQFAVEGSDAVPGGGHEEEKEV